MSCRSPGLIAPLAFARSARVAPRARLLRRRSQTIKRVSVTLTALAAVLAFIPLTTSVFFGSMAYTLIGGTAGGTLLTLMFLPALYALWFQVRPREEPAPADLPPAAA